MTKKDVLRFYRLLTVILSGTLSRKPWARRLLAASGLSEHDLDELIRELKSSWKRAAAAAARRETRNKRRIG